MSSRGLDQPGVLVAYMDDFMAEGTDGTGDSLLGISTVVPIFPIATSLPSSSSALAASSPAPLPPSLSSLSSVPTGKLVRSRKVEKSRVSKKENGVEEGASPSVV